MKTDRPRPLLPASHELLEGWSPRVLLPDGGVGVVHLEIDANVWDVYNLRTGELEERRTDELRLDPCLPHVVAQAGMAWFGSAGLYLTPKGGLVAGGRPVAAPWPLGDQLHVPELAKLPPVDTMAHALVAVGKVRDALQAAAAAGGAA